MLVVKVVTVAETLFVKNCHKMELVASKTTIVRVLVAMPPLLVRLSSRMVPDVHKTMIALVEIVPSTGLVYIAFR